MDKQFKWTAIQNRVTKLNVTSFPVSSVSGGRMSLPAINRWKIETKVQAVGDESQAGVDLSKETIGVVLVSIVLELRIATSHKAGKNVTHTTSGVHIANNSESVRGRWK